MTITNKEDFRKRMNDMGSEGIPFLFVIDFEMKKPVIFPIREMTQHPILFDINGYRNYAYHPSKPLNVTLSKFPTPYEEYEKSFKRVRDHLAYGNSFLVNLTCKTKININKTLKDIFYNSQAKYKLLINEEYLIFSPEIFIKIQDGTIASYPMKGTIDAGLPNAEKIILDDKKELAEHVTIVDLIRNDLSRVANKVHVERFRYIDKIKTNEKELLQVSSEIKGNLPEDYPKRIGDILFSMLPAGSISGAPKQKTVEIIQESEYSERGYFTGVFGYFDGKDLDSGVMIRYIEKQGDDYYFRSGGGITVNSNPKTEYQEMIDKIYVPVN
ncbi:aminodeoxychorismate synthase component I [Fulvivirgaceae bacterium BMA10]|uniref:Aminodeoxychorismate synthase component I n=1 Tax=Splendidivirga corallicola TaxID=3051826 RepID=A0ABT8KIL9_9BACT|nr:aminodeoxychorismate synthase component I [Fulvivirgaceae bacterium BMA10]